MKPSKPANLLKELDLVVSTGLGVPLIAPALFSVLSRLVGAEAGGMCWFSEAGVPQGVYQIGSAQAEIDLFMNHYEELFVGRHEYNPFWHLRNKGLTVGNTLIASREYFRSNTHDLLIKPSHCHFLLDALVDVNRIPRLTVCFFRTTENPFTENDAIKLTTLIPLLRRTLYKHSSAIGSQTGNTENGYILVSEDGLHVHMIDSVARRLLANVTLVDQDITLLDRSNTPPQFIQRLCKELRESQSLNATKKFELAGGTLIVSTCWMTASSRLDPTAQVTLSTKDILVSFQFWPCGAAEIVQTISALGLSPLQSQIAMYAAAGGSRLECAVYHGISKEALKKHLREIYAATRCSDWLELCGLLQNLHAPPK